MGEEESGLTVGVEMEGERWERRKEKKEGKKERKKRKEGVGKTTERTGRAEEDGMQTRVSTETADIESSTRKLS